MTFEDLIFEKVSIRPEKAEAYGFHPDGKDLVMNRDFCDGQFTAEMKIDRDCRFHGKVIEKETGEEYLPLRIHGASGAFVNHVRETYLDLLKETAMHIGMPAPFASDQANRIALAVMEKYGDVPEFPWQDDNAKHAEYGDYGVFRHTGSRKWYALILDTDRDTLAGMKQRRAGKKKSRKQETEKINLLNLKIDPGQKKELWKEKGIYPAFHMNKDHWISVLLDEEISDERIMELVEGSYHLTMKSAVHIRQTGEVKTWIVPANPKYYDIVSAFSRTDDTIWKQGRGIETGDIVYMYVAVPYSAILYRCKVTKAHAYEEDEMELMNIHIEKRYNPNLCTLAKMKEFHVTTVRGPRYMPQDLEEYIKAHE